MTAQCVYIAGTGRNGSTLLGMLLGESSQVFFAGELTHIWARGYCNNELCSCGKPFRDCEFWRAVDQTAFGGLTDAALTGLLRMRDSASALRRVPWQTFGLIKSERKFLEYQGAMAALLTAIQRVSGADWVVDSSKYPTDLEVLLSSPSITTRVIHLVRDCNAVVYAWKKHKVRPEISGRRELMPRYSAITTAISWRLFNSAIVRLAEVSKIDRRLLRYEDLASDSCGTVKHLQQWLGIPVSSVIRKIQHSVSGNPCRFVGSSLLVQMDDEWKSHLPWRDRWIVRLFCRSQQRQYGYS